jgi:hypothetical protein
MTRRLTLSQLVETYLEQHAVHALTINKLGYLLSKATAVFGDRLAMSSREKAEAL